jgi:hypothetical protein
LNDFFHNLSKQVIKAIYSLYFSHSFEFLK